jgi:hypothetical protein
MGHEDNLGAMRCLYCSAEMALLKKLAGSENFCSETHRLAYQKEFSILALNRLMQAHAPVEKTFFPNVRVSPDSTENPTPEPRPSVATSLDPEAAGFLSHMCPPQATIPRPILNEEAIFRFTQLAMPASKAVVIPDITSLNRPAIRPPGRLAVGMVSTSLTSLDLAGYPDSLPFSYPMESRTVESASISANSTGCAGHVRSLIPVITPDWGSFPSDQITIITLEYLDFLGSENLQGTSPRLPPPVNILSQSPGKLIPRVLGNRAGSAQTFVPQPAGPDPRQSATAIRQISFVSQELPMPAIELTTLHLNIAFGELPAVPSRSEAPSKGPAKHVQMSQEPPPAPPSITSRPASAKPAQRLKPRIFAPGPVDHKPSISSVPEQSLPTEFKPAGPRQAIPHPPPLTGARPRAIQRPGLVEQMSGELEPFTEETAGNDSGRVGELGTQQDFLRLVPAWAKSLVPGSFRPKKSDAISAAAKLQAARPVTGIKSTPPGGAGWGDEYASDKVGLAVGRRFQMYQASGTKTNYSVEFTGQIEANSLGWVFRYLDSKNYYGMKLHLQPPGSRGPAELIKWVVAHGEQRNLERVPLPFPGSAGTQWKVKFEARQSKFKTTIRGQVVDVWEDSTIAKGGVGFLVDKGERARIETVEIAW